METPGGDTSWIDGNNERQNRIIHNMVMAGLLDSNLHKNSSAQQKHQQGFIDAEYTVL